VAKRTCAYRHPDERKCGAPRLHDGLFWLFHDPEHADAVAESRKVAGQRRRKEATLATVYDLGDVTSDDGIRRLAHIAVADLLSQDNSLNRAKATLYAIQTLLKVQESGDHEERLQAVESILKRQGEIPSAFREATQQLGDDDD